MRKRLDAIVPLFVVVGCSSPPGPERPAVDPCASAPVEAPPTLAETCLFSDEETPTLSPSVRELVPRFVLWSDGAEKRRWIHLPPGEVVDTSDMDAWRYPVGTRAWKEFVREGVRTETRMLHKRSETEWEQVAYAWSEDQSTATLVAPEGTTDVLGTPHDIPARKQCDECHGDAPDILLGFTAVQVGDALADLADEGLLSDPPLSPIVVPGDDLDRQVLGYLHANCGNCHFGEITPLDTRLLTGSLASVEATPFFGTAVGRMRVKPLQDSDASILVEPGSPETSVVRERMSRRGGGFGGGAMPYLATELVDEAALADVDEWIRRLVP